MELEPKAISVKQFCERYAIGRTTFYEEVKAGRLAVRKLRKRTLVMVVEAERWEDALPSSSTGVATTKRPALDASVLQS